MSTFARVSPALGAAILAACGSTPQAPTVPAALQAPATEMVVLEALASGVQVYECVTDSNESYKWRFKGPQARLVERGGRDLGKHYGGPTWEAPDGSKVVGEVRAQVPSPRLDAIPHLLLNAKSTSGDGIYGAVRSIQRVDTEGGKTPEVKCSQANLAQTARVPYRATYYFYAER